VQRVGFRLQLRVERLDEYIEHHRNVWPDMLEALTETGWTNYSLFLDPSDGTLFGYFETPSLEAALAGMASQEVNARWQILMSDFFLNLDGGSPDQGFLKLTEVFHLQ
jgi:L-rhamnose mutarotase